MVDFLYMTWLGKPIWMWLGFHAVIFILLALDLGLLHRDKSREIGVKESLLLTAFYLTLGLLFGGWVWWYLGPQAGQEYLAGLVVEKSLSMDNVFVIAVIFGYLGIPRNAQHRVLLWGILAAIVLRGLMIGLGAALVHQAEWVLTIFAAFLIYAGIKMLVSGDEEEGENTSADRFTAFMRRHMRVTDELDGQNFTTRKPDPKTGRPALWLTRSPWRWCW